MANSAAQSIPVKKKLSRNAKEFLKYVSAVEKNLVRVRKKRSISDSYFVRIDNFFYKYKQIY
jgi:hypothetical protein